MDTVTELFKVKYNGGIIKAKDTGNLHSSVKELNDIAGVTDISTPKVENTSTGYFYVDITYEPEVTDRTEIAQDIEQRNSFENVIFG